MSYTISTYKIDTTKVIATGFSMGGGLAFQLGLINPTLFKGIIGISPAIGSSQFTQDMWNSIKLVRMAIIDGTLDFNYADVQD
ncbi:MAG: alpha/beta hydrolase-fold protein, partial [bacterium]